MATTEGADGGRRIPRWLQWGAAAGWRVLVVAAALTAVVLVLRELRLVVIPLGIALLLAAILAPPTSWLKGRGLPPALAALLTVALGLFVVLGMIGGAAWTLAVSAGDLGKSLVEGWENFVEWLAGLPALSRSRVQSFLQGLPQRFTDGEGGGGGLVAGASAAVEGLATAILAVVFTFFFVKDGERMLDGAVRWFPEERRDRIRGIALSVWDVVGRFIRGLTVISLINSVLFGLALLAIGVPLVFPLVVLTFIGSYVPFVGAFVASGAAALVALANTGLGDALLVVGAAIVVQQFEGNVLDPFVYGRTLEIPPMLVLIAVTAGVAVAGILGALFAVPITAGAVAAAKEIRTAADEDEGEADAHAA